MNETKFLSDFYNSQKSKDVEIVLVAYELSTDFQRFANSLRKFRDRFGVQYPMLITGARSADADKGAKTLPKLTNIKIFTPSFLLIKMEMYAKFIMAFTVRGQVNILPGIKRSFLKPWKN